MKRLFIEIDEAEDGELRTWQRQVYLRDKLEGKTEVFDTIISEAGTKPQEVLKAIQEHDKIYASTALYDKPYGISSPMLFNNLMYQANKHEIKGKKLYILREFDQIQWFELKSELAGECFKNNRLFVIPDDHADGWREVSLHELTRAMYS